MAIFKCKMCGGSLDIEEGISVIECEYCGTKQTLPKLDDDRKANLYDRANHFRRNNEFDKAEGIYEEILNEDNTDAEAYWSLVLCRYGIEYVEDPQTRKRIPTVNRAQFTSVFDDDNYKSALKYADGYQKSIYEEEAKAINEIQKGILTIAQKEEPFDVFICYKETDNNGRRTHDSVLANDLYYQLKEEGFKVFFARITLEDKLGSAYEPYIFAALNSSKAMVVIGTKPEFFNAVWVKNEWSRYLALIKQGQKKTLIPAYKDMDPYDLPEEFSHLQAQDMSKLGFMQDLIRGIKKIVKSEDKKTTVVKETVVSSENNKIPNFLKRVKLFLEDGDFKSANEYCEKILDIEPENAEAYLGKAMAHFEVRNEKHLSKQAISLNSNADFQKALRFASDELKTRLTKYLETTKLISEKTECHDNLIEKLEKVKYSIENCKRDIADSNAKIAKERSSMTGYLKDAKKCKIKKNIWGILLVVSIAFMYWGLYTSSSSIMSTIEFAVPAGLLAIWFLRSWWCNLSDQRRYKRCYKMVNEELPNLEHSLEQKESKLENLISERNSLVNQLNASTKELGELGVEENKAVEISEEDEELTQPEKIQYFYDKLDIEEQEDFLDVWNFSDMLELLKYFDEEGIDLKYAVDEYIEENR